MKPQNAAKIEHIISDIREITGLQSVHSLTRTYIMTVETGHQELSFALALCEDQQVFDPKSAAFRFPLSPSKCSVWNS